MALIDCPECSRQISDKAAACPHCGCPAKAAQPEPVKPPSDPPAQAPVQQNAAQQGCAVLILFAVLIAGVFACCNACDSQTREAPGAPQS